MNLLAADAADSGEDPPAGAVPVADPGSVAVDRERRLRALVEQYCDFVWRCLRRLGVADADAEDAAQEVFASLSKRLDDVEVGRERSFLYRTAMNHAAHSHRTRLRRREVPDDGLTQVPAPDPTPEELLVGADAKQLFYRALEKIELDLRAVFILYELERMTMAEIADLVDVPRGTVASRLRRARAAFLAQVRSITADSAEGGSR